MGKGSGDDSWRVPSCHSSVAPQDGPITFLSCPHRPGAPLPPPAPSAPPEVPSGTVPEVTPQLPRYDPVVLFFAFFSRFPEMGSLGEE